MICDNCSIYSKYPLSNLNLGHRCRSNEDSCIDGKDCPDYIEECDCKECN